MHVALLVWAFGQGFYVAVAVDQMWREKFGVLKLSWSFGTRRMPKQSGTSKPSKGIVLSRDEQWERHNKNSPLNEDLNREERQAKRIEELRENGVPELELNVRFGIPPNQTPLVNFYNNRAAGLLGTWGRERINYYYLLIFGNGTPQDQGDMNAICRFINETLKPDLEALQQQVRIAGGQWVVAPKHFSVELDTLEKPVPAQKGKRK